MRRTIGNHFMYETGIGLGYKYIFSNNIGFPSSKSQAVINLHLRIGYSFK